jgi:ectoine hydroxylase-related dioxygenase (phytanoyl-CoA dioxygenase family)|tara:strand:+ start:586 stop:1338 length:753 start_codon:yes stop_codon:yes gene_type:complete
MTNNYINLKKEFLTNGFFVCKKIFTKTFISELIEEINKSTETIKYFDNYKNLRRIEKLYDKGKELNNLNEEILKLLKKIFGEKFVIFKDKFNAKPPGGEGFFAHYDGIFHFVDDENNKKNGWYEYGDFFINVLVALDTCNKENGTIELAKAHKGDFNQLLENTKNDGTPALTSEIESNTFFNLINLDVGDIVIFSNTCPHRSKKNNSNKSRRILYYTYSLGKNGSKYEKYFTDKRKSKNPSKALVDKQHT